MSDAGINPTAAATAQATGRFRYWLPLLLVALLFWLTRPAAPPAGWGDDYVAAVTEASSSDKHVLVAFYMRGCPPCHAMDRAVLPSKAVRAALVDYVPIRLDVDVERELANRFDVLATPTFAVIDGQGRLVARTEGYQPTDEFVRFLHRATLLASPPAMALRLPQDTSLENGR